MKLGCMLYSLGRSLSDGTLTVPQALALIKETGGRGVDLMEGLMQKYSPAEMKGMVADAGLAISSHIGGRNLTPDDAATRAEGVDAIKGLIDDSHEMGTDLLLVTTGPRTYILDPKAEKLIAAGGAKR